MSRHPLLALALLRVVIGLVFALHGVQAIFLKGLAPLTQQFTGWQVPLPLLTAPLVSTLELAGGVLLVLGLGTRPIALALAAVMAGAVHFAHWNKGFFGANGAEVPVLLLTGVLALALGGPGQPSFDTLTRRQSSEAGSPPRPANKSPRARGGAKGSS